MRTSAMWGRLAACGGLSTRLQTLPNTGRPAPVASRRAGCHPAPQGAGRSVPGKLCSFGPMSAPHAGFTLLEVLVATLIMAIAITALLSNLSVSLRTAGRLTDNDRAAMVARAKMDELLLDATIPHGAELHGKLDPALTGWSQDRKCVV